MHTNTRKQLLTAAAILCRALAWFPVCILLPSLRAQEGELRFVKAFLDGALIPLDSDKQVLLPAAFVCCMSFIFQLIARAVGQRFRTLPRRVLLLKTAAAIPAAVLTTLAVYRLNGGMFIALLLTAAAVLSPLHGIDREPDKLFERPHFVAFLTIDVITTIMLQAAALPVHMNWYLTVTVTVSVLYLLQRNQFMLMRLVNRRSNAELEVPREIRRGNLLMVAGILLLGAAVFLFREQLITLLANMRDLAAKSVIFLIRMLTRGMGKLFGEDYYETEPDGMPPEQMPEGTFSPLWLVFWIPIILVTWYIWRNLLSEWADVIRDALSRLLAILRGKRLKDGVYRIAPDSDEYYDTETTAEKPLSARKQRRKWRQKLHAWKKLPDTQEKFYAGYALLLESPVWEQDELRDSDTVREIRGKWLCHHTPAHALDAVTEAYHTDRYAERGLPAQAVAELTAVLEQLR